VVFGFAEWAVEKFLPLEHFEANAIVSAVIAMSIFLVFHRIRDFVEQMIEGALFHKWRENESHLKRFVARAAYITNPDALIESTVAELSRFTAGGAVAIYGWNEGRYVRVGGSLPDIDVVLDPNLAPLVALRADAPLLVAEEALPLKAELVLPMRHSRELTGFVVLSAKPTGDPYRPDECAALAEAIQKIGLDLHALRMEALETELLRQHRRADMLEAQLQTAMAFGSR
jgi:hypothetical protein